jgi:hypothetical protein
MELNTVERSGGSNGKIENIKMNQSWKKYSDSGNHGRGKGPLKRQTLSKKLSMNQAPAEDFFGDAHEKRYVCRRETFSIRDLQS